jgi:vacuolar-type H+-ATPase subunit C/Vma6
MPADMTTFAAYYNTRIRGMKSALFSGEQLDDMLESGNIESLIEVLINSPYGPEMGEALTLCRGADAVEDAVSRNFVSTLRRLLEMAEGRFRDLAELFLCRWDMTAAKSLLRVQRLGFDRERAMEALSVGPTLSVPVLHDLAARESVADLVAGLVAWNPVLCLGLSEHVAKHGEECDMAVLEEELERRYYVGTIQGLGEMKEDENTDIFRHMLELEVDRINLRVVFETLQFNTDPEAAIERIMPVGTLRPNLLKRMILSRSVVMATELLNGTRYSSFVEGLFTFMQTGRFSMMTHMFESIALTEVRRTARRLVLSIAVLIYYVYLKSNEARNLRLIARGHAHHVPRARVREGLIHV